MTAIAAGAYHSLAIFEPLLQIGDASITEGDAGTTTMSFTVSLNFPLPETVTVQYATANDSAQGSDFVAKSGTVKLAAGETSKVVTVAIKDDLLDEPDEQLLVNLSSASGAYIDDGVAVGTIVDDDDPPVASINDATVTEGNSGVTEATFTVSLTNPSADYVSVDFIVTDGSATAPSDYQARSGTRTFSPGQVTRTITVPVNGDTVAKPDETFVVRLFDVSGGTLGDGTGTGTIVNDDGTSTLAVSDASLTEPKKKATMTFTVSLSEPATSPVTVAYATADGTATVSGRDYLATSGSLTFDPGVTSQTIAVTVKGDRAVEGNEVFYVNLSSPTNATIADGQARGTIIDDD